MINDRKQELSKKLIIEALKKYRGLFNKSPSDDDLETYGEMLSGQFEFKQVTWALTEHVKKGSAFFPSCGEIFAYLAPKEESSEDRAAIATDEIIRFAQAYGYMQTEKAFLAMSEDARIACGSPTFLLEVCNTPFEDLTTLKAQIRRQAKAAFERSINTAKNEKLQAIGIDTGKVLNLKRPSFDGFLTSGPA